MIRISRLNSARYCGLSGSIEDRSTSIYAMAGNAFHALLRANYRTTPETVKAAELTMSVLEDDVRADVNRYAVDLGASWTPPEDAEFEVPLGIDARGRYVPYDDPSAITRGTADCCWLEPNKLDRPEAEEAEIDDEDGIDLGRFRAITRQAPPAYDGTYTLYVVDFKAGPRAAFNVPHPSENLQTGAYGLGLADKNGAKVTDMRLGIYRVVEGRFVWARFQIGSDETEQLWTRVKAAAMRDSTLAITGSHCGDCWVRRKCPAHVLPALNQADRDEAMAPIYEVLEEGQIVPMARVARMLRALRALSDVAAMAKEWAENYVAYNGPVLDGDQEWGPVAQKGRETVSISSLKAAGLYEAAVAAGAVKKGAASQSYRWTKVSM